jgi:hypothetical protein
MFRGTYPRRRFESFPGNEVTGAAADPGAKKLWFPLSANGSLSLVQTRHLLLQFTNVAAHDVAPDFPPENQLHRQSMLRAVREGVTQESFVSIKSIGTTSSHDPPPLKKTFPNCPREPLTFPLELTVSSRSPCHRVTVLPGAIEASCLLSYECLLPYSPGDCVVVLTARDVASARWATATLRLFFSFSLLSHGAQLFVKGLD